MFSHIKWKRPSWLDCPIRSFFWSVFCRVRTEYEDLLTILFKIALDSKLIVVCSNRENQTSENKSVAV